MKEEIRHILDSLFRGRSCKAVGLAGGIVFGAAVLFVGFWQMVFIFICGLLGLWIGAKLDSGEDIWEIMEQYLPKRFQRFR